MQDEFKIGQPALESEDLSRWVGRVETSSAFIGSETAEALAATLDVGPCFSAGSGVPLPPLWHWACFKHAVPGLALGADGHPRKGGFLPPVSLPRRMWAGSRLRWEPHQPLRLNEQAWRTSSILSIRTKTGRTGSLVFVTVRHEVRNAAGPVLIEDQDIVYRELAGAPPLPVAATAAETPLGNWHRMLCPDEVLLFRYSALTFNAHRIHYDLPYATQVEGYSGLVVQGPLLATLLVDLLRRQAPDARLRSLEFKGLQPSFAGRELHLKGTHDGAGNVKLWAEDDAGVRVMDASALID